MEIIALNSFLKNYLFIFYLDFKINLFLAFPGSSLHALSLVAEGGLRSWLVMCRLLTAVASLGVGSEHRL